MHKGFQFLNILAQTCHSLSGLLVVQMGEMGSHCAFDLHLPNDKRCGTSFHVLVDHLFTTYF